MKTKIIIFLISMLTTMAIYILVKMVFFKADFGQACVFAIPAGLGAAIGGQLYISYLKRKAVKQSGR
jgi:hypothetical protein